MPAAPALSPIESRVWILRGLGHTPARLRLHRGRLRLTTTDGPVFDVALTDATWRKPWWWFGGGFHVDIGGATHKVSFVRPNGAAAHAPGSRRRPSAPRRGRWSRCTPGARPATFARAAPTSPAGASASPTRESRFAEEIATRP
jgi:hypothetical protein